MNFWIFGFSEGPKPKSPEPKIKTKKHVWKNHYALIAIKPWKKTNILHNLLIFSDLKKSVEKKCQGLIRIESWKKPKIPHNRLIFSNPRKNQS